MRRGGRVFAQPARPFSLSVSFHTPLLIYPRMTTEAAPQILDEYE